jgi:NADH-ubiquinone oxidoreductase chain 4L
LIYFILVVGGLYVFSSKRKHLLRTLLSLEFIVLGIFSFFFIYLNLDIIFSSLVYLTLTACEGALGLTILVRISRTHGGDYFNRFRLN